MDFEKPFALSGGVRENLISRERGSDHVLSHHIREGNYLSRGRDRFRIEFVNRRDVLENRRQLTLHPGNFIVAEAKSSKSGDVFNFLARELHYFCPKVFCGTALRGGLAKDDNRLSLA
jgi:hypothetical protein